MNSIEVPEVCALAINNLPVVGRPIWRHTEGKHIVKLEITWQLPRSTTTRRTNQRSKTKRKLLADGVTQGQDGATKMADRSKMAAPTLPTTTDQLNVARCASPSMSMESREKTPPRPRTPSTAAVTTTDQPLEGEWKKVLSRKKSTPKKPTKASTPKEQPVPQRRRTPSPPKKVLRRNHQYRKYPVDRRGRPPPELEGHFHFMRNTTWMKWFLVPPRTGGDTI